MIEMRADKVSEISIRLTKEKVRHVDMSSAQTLICTVVGELAVWLLV